MCLCAFRKFGFVKKIVIKLELYVSSLRVRIYKLSNMEWSKRVLFSLKGSLFSLGITMLNNRVTFVIRNVLYFKPRTCCWSLLEISAWSSGVKHSDHLVETTVDLTAIQVKWHTICSNQLILIIKNTQTFHSGALRVNMIIKYLL